MTDAATTTEPKKRVRKKGEPSKIYSYGAFAPTENLDLVVAQMRLAHDYRNALARRELERRRRVDEALRVVDPEILGIDAEIEAALKAYTEASAEYRKKNSQAGERRAAPDEKAVLSELKRALNAAERRLWSARSATFKRPEWKSRDVEVLTWEREETARIRAQFRGLGLYAGTLDKVADEMRVTRSGPPPRVRPWTGDGKISVQIHAKQPLKAEDLTGTVDADDTRIQVTVATRPGAIPGSRRGERNLAGSCRFRVNSDKSRPVWASFEFVYHRPLPPGKQIKWVRLFRQRIGPSFRWQVQFTVSGHDWSRDDTKKASGRVGIDIGWRVMEDGRLRIAVWKDEKGVSGELALKPGWIAEYRKTEHIQSIRDRDFNEARGVLVAWLRERGELPEWLTERTQTAGQWKAIRRLAGLVVFWRSNRFSGDAEIFARLEAWRLRDKHLFLYEANVRDQLQANRLDLYRCFAADMRRRYTTAVVEGRSKAEKNAERPMDLRPFHELPADEEPAGSLGEKGSRAKENVRNAACSILRRLLKESMPVVETTPAAGTTMICHACESVQDWDHVQLVRTCTSCGVTWDQDANASQNLLARRTLERSNA